MKKIVLFFATVLVMTSVAQGQTVSDTSKNISLLGTWSVDSLPVMSGITYNDIWGYVDCEGNEYAIIGSLGYVHIINVTDPNNLEEVAVFAGGNFNVWRDFKTYRHYLYAASDATGEGLLVFDMSGLPDTVVQTYSGTGDYWVNAHNIFIDQEHGRLYGVGMPRNDTAQCVVLDLTKNPQEPEVMARFDLGAGGYAHDIYVNDNIAYVSQGWQGLYIWDMTDPDSVELLSSISTGEYNHSSWLLEGGEYLIYAEEVPRGRPLGILDVSNMMNGDIDIEHTFKFPLLAPGFTAATPHNPFIRDEFAFVSYYEDGLQIFDMTDPLDPQQVAFYDTHENQNGQYNGYRGNWGVYPFLPSGNLLVSDITRGLMVMRADSIELSPRPAVVNPDLSVLPAFSAFCPGDSVVLDVPGTIAADFYWQNGNGDTLSIDSVLAFSQGDSALFIASNDYCQVQKWVYTEVYDTTQFQLFLLGTDTLLIMNPDTSYTFQIDINGTIFNVDGTGIIPVAESGSYQLIATHNSTGCVTYSEVVQVVISNTNEFTENVLELYPNPVLNKLNINWKDPSAVQEWKIIDSQGRVLLNGMGAPQSIEVPNTSSGVLFLEWRTPDGDHVLPFVKE